MSVGHEAQRAKGLAQHFTAKLGQGNYTACVKSEHLTALGSPGLKVEGVRRMEIKRKARRGSPGGAQLVKPPTPGLGSSGEIQPVKGLCA